MKTKICIKCNKIKNVDEFYKDVQNKTGYRGACKKCEKIKRKKYYEDNHKNYPWIKRFHDINQKCYNIKDDHYLYYGKKGIKNLFKSPDEIKYLWFRDKAFKMKKPSIDRIDNDGNYCLENCRFIEQSINSNRNKMKPVLQFDKQNKYIKEWECLIYAEKSLKIAHSSVWKCVNKKQKTKNCRRIYLEV